MKNFMILLLALVSSASFAGQTITCRAVTKSGVLKPENGFVKLTLEYNKNGQLSFKKSDVEAKNFMKDKNDPAMTTLEIRSINESDKNSKVEYTTIFFGSDEGMLDIQMHFDYHIMKQNFQGKKATFVIGSEDANPETGFAFGTDVICNSRLN